VVVVIVVKAVSIAVIYNFIDAKVGWEFIDLLQVLIFSG